MNSVSTVQAVLVLYRMPLQDSPAYRGLLQAAAAGFPHFWNLMVCDNTPGQSLLPLPEFQGEYVAQPDNPGLAVSYNCALQAALVSGKQWLLLLDQDTAVTSQYLSELQALADRFAGSPEIACIVPKLVENGVVQSPHADLTTKRPEPMALDFSGIPQERVYIYNSGALIRVSALQKIGGFPVEFWLDFLDHATFHQLLQDGRQPWVMASTLQHSLSTNAVPKANDKAYLARHRNILNAEFRFFQRYGSETDRWWYRRRLVHTGLRSIVRHGLFRIGWRALMVALRVRVKDGK